MIKGAFFLTAAIVGFLLAGCDGSSAVGSAEPGLTPPHKNSPVGVWTRVFQDAVGQHYLEVLEVYNDGTYARHAAGWMADRGHYVQDDDEISFQSSADQRHSRDVMFDIRKGKTMTMTTAGPLAQVEIWGRSALRPNFPTVEVDGRRVPSGLPQLAAAVLAVEAQRWQADALPTGISVREQQNTHYAITFSFHSPSSGKGLSVVVTRYEINRSVHDNARGNTAILPPSFLDLPESLAAAQANGVTGSLKKADIKTYPKYDAVWFIRTTAPRGAYIDADSGARINADVTGYVTQYEADWKRAGALWRKAMERYAPKKADEYWGSDKQKRRTYTDRSSCQSTGGGTWHKAQGHHGGFCS